MVTYHPHQTRERLSLSCSSCFLWHTCLALLMMWLIPSTMPNPALDTLSREIRTLSWSLVTLTGSISTGSRTSLIYSLQSRRARRIRFSWSCACIYTSLTYYILILCRKTEPTGQVKTFLSNSLYFNKVFYFTGSPLVDADLERVQLRLADAYTIPRIFPLLTHNIELF